MILLKMKFLAVLIFLISITVFFSCGKKDDASDKDNGQIEQTGQEEITAIDENDFTESDEDLLNVDYKEFYDELAPHGEWIEVTDKEIGIELKKGSASGEKPHRTITLAELFGIKNAYADEVSFVAFFIWQPSPNLAVTVTAGDPAPAYVPYTNGNWVYSDAGWYYRAPTRYEEVCHHHGRWVYSPALGWVWMPGRVWAPAWVEWKENDTYIAWTPVPPGIYITNDRVFCPPFPDDRYIVIEKRHFGQPDMYKYMYKENKNKIMIKEWSRVDGVIINKKTVINKGPDVDVIRKVSGNEFKMHKVSKVKKNGDVSYTATEINSYSPDFKKYKSGESKKKVKPDNFKKFEEVKKEGKDKESTGEETDINKDKGKKDKEDFRKDKGDNKQKQDKIKGKDNKQKNKEDKSKGKDFNKDSKKEKGVDKNMKDGGKNKEDRNTKQNDNKSEKDKSKGKK